MECYLDASGPLFAEWGAVQELQHLHKEVRRLNKVTSFTSWYDFAQFFLCTFSRMCVLGSVPVAPSVPWLPGYIYTTGVSMNVPAVPWCPSIQLFPVLPVTPRICSSLLCPLCVVCLSSVPPVCPCNLSVPGAVSCGPCITHISPVSPVSPVFPAPLCIPVFQRKLGVIVKISMKPCTWI